MKRIWSILIVAILLLSFTQDANAAWRGRWYGGWRGYGYGVRPYLPPVVAPVPAPYYRRPYYAPMPAPVPGRWIAPHWRRGPYGDQWIRGHYAR